MTRTLQALALATAMGVSSIALAAQPHMEAALAKLREAKEELNKADADKGGHRVNSIKAVDVAIDQVRKGIEYDKEHGDDKAKMTK